MNIKYRFTLQEEWKTKTSFDDILKLSDYNDIIEIDCSKCGLVELPKNLPTSLQLLDCSYNKLTSLPIRAPCLCKIIRKPQLLDDTDSDYNDTDSDYNDTDSDYNDDIISQISQEPIILNPKISRSNLSVTHKIFHDCVHGDIFVSLFAKRVIGSRIFQRLRHISQLGVCSYVFHNAVHNRFGHSIGTYYLAGRILESIKNNTGPDEIKNGLEDIEQLNYYFNGKIPELDSYLIEMVKISALCHDIGHGPFSHIFDKTFESLIPDCKYTEHEERSIFLLERIIKEDDLLSSLVSDDDIYFMKSIIKPSKSCKGFIYQIVANKLNNLDVDKYDYIYRDSYTLNIQMSFNFRSIVENAKIINGIVCYPETAITDIYNLFQTRHYFYRNIYCTKRVVCYDIVMDKILIELDKILNIKKCLEDFENLFDDFIHLTDSYILGFPSFLRRFPPEGIDTKPFINLVKRMTQRIHPKFIGMVNTTKALKSKELKSLIPGGDNLILRQIKVGFVGGNGPNPLDNVYLYKVREGSSGKYSISEKLKKDDISLLVSNNYQEYMNMFFADDLDDKDIERMSEHIKLVNTIAL